MKRRWALAVLPAAALTFAVPDVAAAADCSVSSYLTQGRRGSDQVRCVQQSLNDRGFNSGPVDGYFGPVTGAAVLAYQQANGLTADGEVGAQTAGSLGVWQAPRVAAAASRPTRRSSSSGGSTGRSGVNWDKVAQCESGGQWGHGTATNSHGSFSGGLMIMNSAWRQYGGTEFAPTAGQASRGEQIIVAERIAARVGAARAWQCPVG